MKLKKKIELLEGEIEKKIKKITKQINLINSDQLVKLTTLVRSSG
jgi:hypothetical protein